MSHQIILTLKHWQLFLLFIGIPVIGQAMLMTALAVGGDPMIVFNLFPILAAIMAALFFGWFYALGTNLCKKVPPSTALPLTRFKIFLGIPAGYILAIGVLMAGGFLNGRLTEGAVVLIPAVIFPLHLFSMFCIFYCMYFIAKALKKVEGQRAESFSDFAGEFFLIWFFPIGIWILQPRINAIFARTGALHAPGSSN